MAFSNKKITVQSLNALFSILDHQSESTLWIRSADFSRQLFVNENYQKIWQRQPTELYQHPESLIETLYPIDRDAINQQLAIKQEHHLEKNNIFYYRVITPEGRVKFIKDWHYLLTDQQDNLVGFAGLAQEISQGQWQIEFTNSQKNQNSDPKAQLQQYIFDILQNELHLKANQQNGSSTSKSATNTVPPMIIVDQKNVPINLTRREEQVIKYLRDGMSAKQTANEIHVSTRTVEFHLNNIKTKSGCRTKLELLSRIEALNLDTV